MKPFVLCLEWEHYYADTIDEPQVVVHKSRVYDLNAAAKGRGVVVGMRLQHVLPLVPGCKVKDWVHDLGRQHSWLNHLLSFSDVIQPVSPHCAVVDLSAHPSPEEIAARVVARLSPLPYGVLHFGVGPAMWIAGLAVRQRDPYRYAARVEVALAPQSIDDLLAVDPVAREQLKALGVVKIGDIHRVGMATLRSQFGDQAHQIVQAAKGKAQDKVAALYPPKAASRTVRFEAPVNESLPIQQCAGDLSRQLAEVIAGRQASRVTITAEQEDGNEKTLNRSYNRPIHTPDRIEACIRYLIDQVQKDCPDIVRVTIQLSNIEPVKSSQFGLFETVNPITLEVANASLQAAMGGKSVVLASQVELSRREKVLSAWRNATGWH